MTFSDHISDTTIEADDTVDSGADAPGAPDALDAAIADADADERDEQDEIVEIVEVVEPGDLADADLLDVLDDDAEVAPREPSPYERPGDWFVVHTYAGYENKVKQNLASRVRSMNVEEQIFAVAI